LTPGVHRSKVTRTVVARILLEKSYPVKHPGFVQMREDDRLFSARHRC